MPESEYIKWLLQQAPAIVVCCWVIWQMFKQQSAIESARTARDVRLAEELKGVAETLSALSTTVALLFGRIKGGGGS